MSCAAFGTSSAGLRYPLQHHRARNRSGRRQLLLRNCDDLTSPGGAPPMNADTAARLSVAIARTSVVIEMKPASLATVSEIVTVQAQ